MARAEQNHCQRVAKRKGINSFFKKREQCDEIKKIGQKFKF